jgi:hypothetical protein
MTGSIIIFNCYSHLYNNKDNLNIYNTEIKEIMRNIFSFSGKLYKTQNFAERFHLLFCKFIVSKIEVFHSFQILITCVQPVYSRLFYRFTNVSCPEYDYTINVIFFLSSNHRKFIFYSWTKVSS